MAANLVVGQTEAPLAVRPYIEGMTRSELNTMMTGGFSTVAGSVLVVYMGLIGPEVGPHLLTASLLSAPAAFVIAKIICPETQTPATAGHVAFRLDRRSGNLIEAAATGTTDGLKLYLNVLAMIIAFTALVELVNWPLGAIGSSWLSMPAEGPEALSLSRLCGWVLAPLAWAIGVGSWHDSQLFGGLIGTKIFTNEFIAYLQFQEMVPPAMGGGQGSAADDFTNPRSAKMAAYALCGFANFASIGVQIGGITPLAPGRKRELAQLALRAMLGGALASATTATIAGMFLD